jgi:glycerophosphoryl diester phosphodiesterase
MTQVLRAVMAALLASAACGPSRPPSAPAPAAAARTAAIRGLELVGEFNMPPPSGSEALAKARFGGVSGLALDPSSGDLLGICDDNAESRVFVFRLAPPAAVPFSVGLHAYFPLPAEPGPAAALDPEGIAITRGGRLFVASEGLGHREPRVPPGIFEYTRGYHYVGELEVPGKFHPPVTGGAARGVRPNAAFESLTLTPDEQRLYTATETALVQDGEPATTGQGTLARILEYRLEGKTFVPAREFAYPVDPLPRPDFTPGFFITGLVELLATGGAEFLSMERGYAEEGPDSGGRMNTIRIFRVSIDGATDVSALDSLRGRQGIVPVRKQLLLDLAGLDGLSPEMAALDNFEGMAFGPALPDGSPTLLIVSDDNFSPRQRTSFLLFRIRH